MDIQKLIVLGAPLVGILVGILLGVWKTAFAVGSLVKTQADHSKKLSKHDRILNNHSGRLTKLDNETFDPED